MRKKRMKTGKQPLHISAGIGVGISVLIAIMGGLVCALCIHNEYLNMEAAGVGAYVVLFCSVLVGALIASSLVAEKNLIVAGAVCVADYVLLICCAMAAFDGVGDRALLGLIVCLAAGLCVIVLNFSKEKAGNKPKRRKAFR